MRTLTSLLVALAACGGSSSDSPDAAAQVTPDAASNWNEVKAHYGRLLSIAGAGATDTGTNEWLAGMEGGAATAAELSRPHMAQADAAGNIYIADKEAHAIRKVTPAGVITTYAGTGAAAAADDTPGPATQRALANPNGLFVQPDGTLYILDLDHARIRKVDTGGTMTTLFTVVGNIALGRGLWVSGAPGAETVYFSSGNVVKRWTAGTGVATWATGFSGLGNIAMDGDRLLVTDRTANRVYAVTDLGNGMVSKVPVAGSGTAGAGVDGMPATSIALEGVRAVWPANAADGGGFFLGTHEGCQLWFVDAAGIAHLFVDGEKDAHAGIGEAFDTPGKKLSEMRSVTLDGTGNVIIVDDDRGFVTRIERK
jgi:hypothetical protein